MLRALTVAVAVAAASPAPEVMNKGGVPYTISNPPGSTKGWMGQLGTYSTNFYRNVKGPVEHFDVYGEVRTKYSQVYWTRNAPISLPPELVERFKGKVMAITGYEIDQVTHTGPQINSSTFGHVLGGFACYPDCSETDKSVPSYHAYNHHYFSWLMGKDSEIYDREKVVRIPNPTQTGIRDLPHGHSFPTNIVFKENPGGEFRKSYHGYPSGYAQLIHSPTQWVVEPMQIDTHNRNFGINDQVGYKPWFLPKLQQNNMTDLQTSLSPLIECPCSDRITRKTTQSSVILVEGTCDSAIKIVAACTAAVAGIGRVSSSATVSDASMPFGCIMVPGESHGSFTALFNSAQSTQSCNMGKGPLTLQGEMELEGFVNLSVSHDGDRASITMSGPDGAWFAVGFGAEAMSSAYAIIVDGTGAVSERKLGNHDPGALLKPSVTVLTSSAINGTRTVVLDRPVAGVTNDHYSIPTTPGDVQLIAAVGNTQNLAYHKARTGAKIVLVPTAASSCICTPKTTKSLVYMNTITQTFAGYDCVDEPRGDMLKHGDGTGRNVPNMACHMETYHGGLQCCKHQFFLTDLEDDARIPDVIDTYFLKWRYYFQEYKPADSSAPASHQHLHHWVFLIDAQVNDYEEDNARYGTQSIGKISAHLTARDIGLEDTPTTYSTITPLVMTPHCHAPSCIREEFWNADTGEIICNVTAMYGSLEYGSLSQVFNEADYLSIPPCIFGNQPGLQKPFSLSPDTKITAIKYFNNTFRHLGQMAQWTGLMVYDHDPPAVTV